MTRHCVRIDERGFVGIFNKDCVLPSCRKICGANCTHDYYEASSLYNALCDHLFLGEFFREVAM